MLFAAFLSKQEQLLDPSSWETIGEFLEPKLRSVTLPKLDYDLFSSLLLHDKKASREAVNFILLREIGSCFIQKEMTLDLIWKHFTGFCKEFPNLCQLTTD